MAQALPLYQVDAFTDKAFGGNPAAVCPLRAWLPDTLMQKIAAENNLSETAFFVPEGDNYHIRWFTPAEEVKLCGHATLASAFVIFNFLAPKKDFLIFSSLSGPLMVRKNKDGMVLNFPVWTPTQIDVRDDVTEALGAKPLELYTGPDWVAVFERAADIQTIAPDMVKLAKIPEARGIIVTAAGTNGIDFVSRAFFPGIDVPEDPATGSAHCILTPIWAEKTGKTEFRARQISKRGGDLLCALKGERVEITGKAVLYLKGEISL